MLNVRVEMQPSYMRTNHSLLQQPESKSLELRRDLSSPRSLLKSVVAFANSAGGRLVVGVDDEQPMPKLDAKALDLDALVRWLGTGRRLDGKVLQTLGLLRREQVGALLRHCASQHRSKRELPATLGLRNAYMNYRRLIVPLLEQGLIAMTLPDKPSSRLQRYRLTSQGHVLLDGMAATKTSRP